MPTLTPWGYVRERKCIMPGAYLLKTDDAGGIRISKTFSLQWLSEDAVKHAELTRKFYWFDEDTEWAVLAWEVPQIREYFYPDEPEEDARRKLLIILSEHHADYLEAVGVEPLPEQYEKWKEKQEYKRLEELRSPDLIVACWGEWKSKIKGVCEAMTADGKIHLIDANSYYTLGPRAVIRLSQCQIYETPA